MKRATVFGGSGFLGSHVADALGAAGYSVVIYDLAPSKYLQPGQRMVVGDILDEKKVAATLKGGGVVYNFAGISNIDEAERDPLQSVKKNVLGNTIILEACRKYKVKRYVFASTLYVYSNAGSFYRSTKQACELLIENYAESFGLPYTILRYGSLYGPRAGEDNFVHSILRQAVETGQIVRQGDGEELREYIHVTDAARSSVEVLAGEFKDQYVMITGDRQIKVKDLLLIVREMLGKKVRIKYVPCRNKSHYEITPYSFSPRLAKKLISRTYVDLGQGILACLGDAYYAAHPKAKVLSPAA